MGDWSTVIRWHAETVGRSTVSHGPLDVVARTRAWLNYGEVMAREFRTVEGLPCPLWCGWAIRSQLTDVGCVSPDLLKSPREGQAWRDAGHRALRVLNVAEVAHPRLYAVCRGCNPVQDR